MANQIINYGKFKDWAQKINARNDKLNETLRNIQKTINGLEGSWESDAAVTTRERITAMTPRFEQYQSVVKNYATFLNNTAEQYRTAEEGLNSNARRFPG